MATKYLGNNSLLYLLTLIKTKLGEYATTSSVATALANKVDVVSGKGLSTNDYTTAEKTKLAGIAEKANNYTLPTAAKGTLGGVTTTSTVTSATGYTAAPIISGVPYYKDTNTTYDVATANANGLMSSTDKTKLDEMPVGCINLDWSTKNITYNSTRIAASDLPSLITAHPELKLKVTNLQTYAPTYVFSCINQDSGLLTFGGMFSTDTTDPCTAIVVYLVPSTETWTYKRSTVPTKTSELTNNSDYTTKAYVDEAISGITGLKYEIVDTLPSTGETGTIYLVPKTAETRDIYNEYIWVNSAFELIGTTAPDLSQYVKTSDLVEITNAEVQTAWDNA